MMKKYDFTSPYIAEFIYDFLLDNQLLNVPREFHMSMLEYVSLVCPDEFAEYLYNLGLSPSLFEVS